MRYSNSIPPVTVLSVVLCIAVAAFVCVWFGPCLQDDAFISLRYARNWVDGHGLVYNPGERVEGYTNLAWTLLLAIPHLLPLDPVPTVAWMGGICFLASIGIAAWAGIQTERSALWTAVPAAVVALDPWAALEAVEGLETALMGACITLGVALFFVENRQSRGISTHIGSGVVFAAASTVRPEAPLLLLLLHAGTWGATVWAGSPAIRRERTLQSVVGGTPALATLVVLTAWRLMYYGEPLPNTFYAKTGAAGWDLGFHYLLVFGREHPLAVFAVLSGIGWGTRKPVGFGLMAACLGFFVYVASVGGDFKPTGRFLLPLVGAMGLWGLLGLLTMKPQMRRWWLVLAALVWLSRVPFVFQSANEWAAIRHANVEARRTVGEFLRASVPHDTWMAIHSAGAIPYYANIPTIDMWGLTDHHIARAPVPAHTIGLVGHERGDPAYVFGRAPALYLPEDKVFTLMPWPLEVEAGFPADFAENYRSISVPVDGRFLNMWVRKGFLKALHQPAVPTGAP